MPLIRVDHRFPAPRKGVLTARNFMRHGFGRYMIDSRTIIQENICHNEKMHKHAALNQGSYLNRGQSLESLIKLVDRQYGQQTIRAYSNVKKFNHKSQETP